MRWICVLMLAAGCSGNQSPPDSTFVLQQFTFDCKEIEHITPPQDQLEWTQLATIRTRRMLLLADNPMPAMSVKIAVESDYEFWRSSQKETPAATAQQLREEYLIATRITAERFRLRGMENYANMISRAFTPEQAAD